MELLTAESEDDVVIIGEDLPGRPGRSPKKTGDVAESEAPVRYDMCTAGRNAGAQVMENCSDEDRSVYTRSEENSSTSESGPMVSMSVSSEEDAEGSDGCSGGPSERSVSSN